MGILHIVILYTLVVAALSQAQDGDGNWENPGYPRTTYPLPTTPPGPEVIACHDKYDCKNEEKCKSEKHCEKKTCFPGDAVVETPDRKFKFMHELEIGDKIVVSKSINRTIYSDVYAFGHKDNSTKYPYFKVEMVSAAADHKSIEISYGHFVPTISSSGARAFYKRAENVKRGDIMWASDGNSSLVRYTVTAVTKVWKQGLFNPFTLSGTIMVGNVVASAHSEWFLDSLFHQLKNTAILPTIYQVILVPVRVLYTIGGEYYKAAYVLYDAYTESTNYGGLVVSMIISSMLICL